MNKGASFYNQEITLSDMLSAREARVSFRNELIEKFCLPVITFTMNIAGPVKITDYIERAFDCGTESILKELSANDIKIEFEQRYYLKTGCIAYIVPKMVFDCPSENDTDFSPTLPIKKICISVEETHPLGRLFDIDVTGVDHKTLSGENLRAHDRNCIICGATGRNCASRRLHSVTELQEKTFSIINDYFLSSDSLRIERLISNALCLEIATTPKPGLVDLNNNGSHKDMNPELLKKSVRAIEYYFKECFLIGRANKTFAPEETFPHLKKAGILAEKAMFNATKGINTHKGAVFIFGLISAACGRLWTPGGFCRDISEICNTCADISVSALRGTFKNTAQRADTENLSHGEQIYLKSGIKGIRGEVIDGLPSVKKTGLPVLEDLLSKNYSINEAGCICLLNLIASTVDTNMIHRSSLETAENIMKNLSGALKKNPCPSKEWIEALDKEFINLNLSPGGSADLLAVTYFFHFLKEDQPL